MARHDPLQLSAVALLPYWHSLLGSLVRFVASARYICLSVDNLSVFRVVQCLEQVWYCDTNENTDATGSTTLITQLLYIPRQCSAHCAEWATQMHAMFIKI